MQITLPISLQNLFWDIDVANLNPVEGKWFVIERIINRGNTEAIDWLLSVFASSDIIDNLQNNYNISTKAIEKWSQVFNLIPSQCKCTLRPSALRVFD